MIYLWKCEACDHEEEVVRSVADIEIGPEVRPCLYTTTDTCSYARIIQPSSFELKGYGWYRDGYSGRSLNERKK